jgi:hypothetical protein
MITREDEQVIRNIIRDEVRNLRRSLRIGQSAIIPKAVKQGHIEANIIFSGDAADRPDGTTEAKAYFASDTGVLSLWDGSAWVDFPRIPASPATYTPTNVTTDRSYDADSTTTAELADVLGTLIADLQSIGLID